MSQFQITLQDGRTVILEEANEDAAIRAAARWQKLNPPGEPVQYYEVTLENGDVKNVPAVSEQAATEFTAAWGPEQEARQAAERAFRPSTDEGEVSQYGATENAVNAASLGLDKMLNAGLFAAETGVRNLFGDDRGFSAGDAFNLAREVQNEEQRGYQDRAPVASLASGLVGGLATPGIGEAGAFVTGGQGARGLLASENLLPIAGRSAAVSAPYGATAGLLNSDPGSELESAAQGGIVAGVTGGVIPVAARGATAVTRGLGIDQIPAVINRATGGRIAALNGDVDRRAIQRLGDSLRRDGLSQTQIRDAMNEAVRNGVTPNLLNVIGPNATRTRALIQGAAMKPGPAQTAATQYRNNAAANLQDEAINQAYRLTPGETRTAQQYRTALDETRDGLAATEYAPVYDTRVPVTDDIRTALSEVPAELEAARRASSFRFPERAAEIEGLANPDEYLDDISAGALDRVQRRLGQAGRNRVRSIENADNEMAADFYARQGVVNDALDSVPELAPARATYRGYQTASDASELGQSALQPSTRPADYADELGRLQAISDETLAISNQDAIPSAMQGAGVGLRDQIVNTIGNLPEGATGFLNRLSTARNPAQVLDTTYGAQGGQFREGVGALVTDLNNARFIDPSTGSQTASRLASEDLVSAVPTKTQIVLGLINKIRRGATLTDADREALVRLSTEQMNFTPNLGVRGAPISGRIAPVVAAQGGG